MLANHSRDVEKDPSQRRLNLREFTKAVRTVFGNIPVDEIQQVRTTPSSSSSSSLCLPLFALN